jgi:hypothetical protein
VSNSRTVSRAGQPVSAVLFFVQVARGEFALFHGVSCDPRRATRVMREFGFAATAEPACLCVGEEHDPTGHARIRGVNEGSGHRASDVWNEAREA